MNGRGDIMQSLEDVRKVNRLSLEELGKAMFSLWINPNTNYEVTTKEAKRIADWTVGYREFDF